jgi:hypothetical protein
MTTFIVNTIPDLQTALADLEDAVKIEVSPGVGILAKTVADLRQLTVLPGPTPLVTGLGFLVGSPSISVLRGDRQAGASVRGVRQDRREVLRGRRADDGR